MKRLLVLLLAVSCCFVYAAKKSVILGNPSEYTILIPDNAGKPEIFSANFLAKHLEQLYKVNVPVVREGMEIKGNVISIGETVLAKKNGFTSDIKQNGYEFSVKGKDLFIRGGYPGPLYGVVTFLEEDLGCRWYAEPLDIKDHPDPGLTVLPDLSGKPLQIVPRSYAPQFTMREIRYLPGWYPSNVDHLIYSRYSPITYYSFLPKESGAQLNSKLFIHTYSDLLPAKKYYDEHPEYFALLKGKRFRQTHLKGSVCYTNPNVKQIMAESIREEIRKVPEARFFSVSCNDTGNTDCECENCAPLIKKLGKHGIQIWLANQIAEILCKEYPDIRLTTLVYGSGTLDTNSYKTHPNVILFVAPIGARWNLVKMLIPLSENQTVKDTITNSRKSSGNIFFWDYIDTHVYPFPNFDQMQDSLHYLINEKVIGYLADCTNGGTALAPVKRWVYSHLLWDPGMDMEALIREFVPAYYGKAAPEITEYIRLLRNAWKNFKVKHDKENGIGVMLEYTAAEKQSMRKLLDSAWKKAENDDVLKGRIAREYLPFLALVMSGNPKLNGVEQYEKDYNFFCEMLAYTRWDSLHVKEKKNYEKKLNWAKQPPEKDLYSPNTVVVYEPVTNGRYREDPKSVKGKASRHEGKTPWGIQWYYTSFKDFLIPGKTYVMRLKVRQECNPLRTSGPMFDLWTYHHGNEKLHKQGGFHAEFTEKDGKGEYRYVTLGKVKFENPSATGMFWMNTLVDLNEAVWYERMELIPLEEFREKELIQDKTLIL